MIGRRSRNESGLYTKCLDHVSLTATGRSRSCTVVACYDRARNMTIPARSWLVLHRVPGKNRPHHAVRPQWDDDGVQTAPLTAAWSFGWNRGQRFAAMTTSEAAIGKYWRTGISHAHVRLHRKSACAELTSRRPPIWARSRLSRRPMQRGSSISALWTIPTTPSSM